MARKPARRSPPPPPTLLPPVVLASGPCPCGAEHPSFGIGPPASETWLWLCRACWLMHPTQTERRDEALDKIMEAALEGIEDD